MKAVRKANNDLISFCECEGAFGTTGQLDCPWCGCGWMFACTNCNRAFTFGEVFETDITPLELGRKMEQTTTEPDDEVALSYVGWLEDEPSVRMPGETVVILDGSIHPIDARNITFDGWFARHRLEQLPQTVARNRDELLAILGDVRYWTDRELPEEEKR